MKQQQNVGGRQNTFGQKHNIDATAGLYYYIKNYRTPQVVNYLIFSDISGWLLATGTALIVAER
jgi:hypothetical protein